MTSLNKDQAGAVITGVLIAIAVLLGLTTSPASAQDPLPTAEVSTSCGEIGFDIEVVVTNPTAAEIWVVAGSEIANLRNDETAVVAAGATETLLLAGRAAGSYLLEVTYMPTPDDAEPTVLVSTQIEAEACGAFAEIQAELAAALATWQSLGDTTLDYDLEYTEFGASEFLNQRRDVVQVRNGVGATRFTVEQFFMWIQEVIEDGIVPVGVQFDDSTGHPTYFQFPGDASYVIEPVRFLSDCCDPPVALDVVVSCPALGRLDIAFVSTASAELTFELLVGSIPPRQLTVAPGGTGVEVVTGRPDSVIPVELTTGGERVAFVEVVVNCDPSTNTKIDVSCVDGRGRIDIWFVYDGDGDSFVPITVLFFKDQANYPDAIVRSVEVRTGEPTRTTLTGRDDGQYSIVWSTIGGQTNERTVTVACDNYEAAVTVEVSCLAGNGRIDVLMFNNGDSPETYAVSIGALSARERYIVPEGGNRITATGRPDGPISVSVLRGDELIYDEAVTVDCPDLL